MRTRVEVRVDCLTEAATWDFVTEASTVGLAPGEQPRELAVPGLGNGQPFDLQRVDDHGTLLYRQRFGCVTVAVLND